jgi:protein-disulfide isomerase
MLGAGSIVVAFIFAAIFTMSNNSASNSLAGASTTTRNEPANSATNFNDLMAKVTAPSIQNAPPLGKDTAKVTLVEFGDYQCTYCHRWHTDTKEMLINNFVDTGKVKFLFKDFPINDLGDKASSLASQASYCAAEQGKYWNYHDALYNNWKGENTGWVTKNNLEKFAQSVSISNISAFSNCLSSGKYSGIVKSNYDLATSIGLDATPSFIVFANGESPKLIKGAYPYSTFEEVLNDMYKNSTKT